MYMYTLCQVVRKVLIITFSVHKLKFSFYRCAEFINTNSINYYIICLLITLFQRKLLPVNPVLGMMIGIHFNLHHHYHHHHQHHQHYHQPPTRSILCNIFFCNSILFQRCLFKNSCKKEHLILKYIN